MPTGTRATIGNEIYDCIIYLPAVTFPTLGANASATNTISVPGCIVGDFLSWNLQAPPAHLVLDNLYVSAPGVITALWGTDGTGISTATVPILFGVVRAENATLGLASLPQTML